jgi:acyl-[acyl carrier protein]--UDP-N-acetylglucosamine O-acyltransferase
MIRRTVAVALFCAAFASAHAHANEDSVQFFTNIHVAADEQVHDAVCFFCNVEAEGKVTGDVVVFFGNIDLAGTAQHDVVSIFGNVTGDDNAAIDNNLVSIFGSVRLGDHVHIGEDLVAVFGSLRTGQGVTVGGDRVVEPGVVFFGPFFILIIVFIVVIREFRCWRRRQFLRGYGYPPHP